MEEEVAGRAEARARGAGGTEGLLRTDVQPDQAALHGAWEQIPEHAGAAYRLRTGVRNATRSNQKHDGPLCSLLFLLSSEVQQNELDEEWWIQNHIFQAEHVSRH